MRFYLVKRTDDWDYDEYDEVLVRAPDAETARLFVAFAAYPPDYFDASARGKHMYSGLYERNTVATEVLASGETEVIISSFRAG